MWRLLQLCCCCWWIFSLVLPASVPLWADCHPALTGSQAKSQALIHGFRKAEVGGARLRRAATEETYWAYSGIYGPDEGWASAYPECREKNQSPINIVDQDTKVSTEYQELTLEGFDTESSNKTSMKNTGKTVAIMLKDDYFVRGAGLPGRFKAEKVEFHWGPSNGSEGSEHSINGRRYPVEMQIYMYNSDDFDSLSGALRERRIIAAMAVFFQVGGKDNPAVDPIIHGLKGVVHHEKETFLEPFVLKDLLPSSLGSYYRYTGSLTTPPCSKVVEWIIFNRPIYVSYKQLEAFYSIFTTEQQDHVKSVEYLRSNFRPIQSLDNRHVFKSAVKDAWLPDLTDSATGPYGAEASKVCSSAPINMKVQHVNGSALVVRWSHPEVTYHPPILHFLVSYSWTAHDDSYEETHLTDAKHKLEAIISPVSPDVLYLFRVQAVCTNDMRSDFSQSMLFRANTTRIFEGTRIVKTGMPTVSPASSADMAPISSGSSTWTSSGIPFSFVSMATGIGPSSSGSQATVASVVTSTLLAGLGFSGGVISSFPSVVWPSRVLVHNPTSTHQTTELTKDTTISASDVTTAVAKDNGEAGDEDSKGQGEDEDSEEEDKKEEEEEEKDKKKGRKGSGQVGNARIKDSSRVSEQPNETEDSTAKKKKQTEPDPTKKTNIIQLDVYTHNPFDSNSSTTSGAAFPVLKDHAGALKPSTGRDKKPFSIHIECPSALNNVTDHARPRSRTGLGQVECLVLLVVVSALTFFCLVLLLVVLIYWRRCFQRVHLHVEDHSSPRVVPNEMMPVVSIPDDMEAISVKQLIKHIPELYSNNQQGFSEDFEGVKGNPKAWAQHEQTVLQYYYTKWPDMDILPVLTFVCRSPAAQTPVMGLVFAHFSAGVGQTGTYIVTDSMLQQIRNKSTVIVLGFLKQIRTQHNYLVLTEERYIFTHNALMVADLMKTTEMAARQIHFYLTHITTPGHSGITHLDKQFKLVTQCNVRFMESFTTQDCNKGKNQNSSVVLLEQVRVNLVPLPGIKGTNHINVSYIMGYYRSNKSIITQQPLPNTTKDFWRLIWDHNSQIIVILPTVHGQDLYVLKACHFQCPKWPNPDASLSTTFELTDIIKEEMSTFDRPTIIYDKFTTLSQQPNNEDTVNVYQVAEMIMRSRVFTDIDKYRYLYKAMFSFVSTKENSSGLLASDTNRTIVSMSNQKDSKESLM